MKLERRKWSRLDHDKFMGRIAFRVLSGEAIGDFFRIYCHCAAYITFLEDPIELGEILRCRPTSAVKRFEKIRHLFTKVGDLSEKYRQIVEELDSECRKNSEKYVVEDHLEDALEYASKCNQASRSGKRGADARWGHQGMATAIAPDSDVDVDQDRDEKDNYISLPSGEAWVEEVDFVPPVRKRKPTSPFSPEKVEEALKEHKKIYDALAGLFGHGVRPARDVPKLVAVLESGAVTPENLIKAAEARWTYVSGARFMGSLGRWLDEGSYLVTTGASNTGNTKVPAHRREAEEASQDDWEAYVHRQGNKAAGKGV